MMPSPEVGSGVDVRQTMMLVNICIFLSCKSRNPLSTFWKVNTPSLSYWVPLLVTVKFRLIPAQLPTAPQSVGGLSRRGQTADSVFSSQTYT